MAKSNNAPKVETTVIVSEALDKMTPEQRLAELLKEHKTISGVIRFLLPKFDNKAGPTGKYIGKRYQHVNNVMRQPLKKAAPATE